MLSVVSHLVPLQVWKYCDDCKTVLSHPRYDVPRPGTGEDLVRQHGDLTECLWKLYFYGVERDDVYVFSCDAATCGTTRSPRCWLWRTSTQAAKFWCLILVLASCSEPSWREWGVRRSWELLKSAISTFPFFFPSALLCNHPLFPHSSRLRLSDPNVPRRRACPGGYGELWLPCTFSRYAAWVSHLPCQCSAGRHSGHHCQRSQHW